eukprot:scaffold10403_cov101-Isochrysis_galbana.AAC.5
MCASRSGGRRCRSAPAASTSCKMASISSSWLWAKARADWLRRTKSCSSAARCSAPAATELTVRRSTKRELRCGAWKPA